MPFRSLSITSALATGFLFITTSYADVEVHELPYARAAIDATGFHGSMLIYDMNTDTYVAGHVENLEQAHIPASTFKIMSSLVALETGVIADSTAVMEWDGVTRSRPETNVDMDLRQAFQLSSVPHYQELVRQIGHERMQSAIDVIAYGNQNINGGIDQFWLTGELRISPRQQIELLQRLYHNELPFSIETMTAVKDIMVLEATADYVLRAKTGLAVLNENENTGWWVGWVEHGDKVTMFATVLSATAPDPGFIPARLSVTRDVLSELGVLP